jgi:orotidine-5'-phosphate decarboxylase
MDLNRATVEMKNERSSRRTPANAKERVIVALDVDTVAEALKVVEQTRDSVGAFKVGLELFSSVGPSILDELKKLDVNVFFDGKFHDIPNTVSGAVRAIASRDVFILNVHATGGAAMLTAAKKSCVEAALQAGVEQPILIGVTLLTSMDSKTLKNDLGLNETPEAFVPRLAKLCLSCGLDGVVASAQETKLIREACGKDFVIVTPGIRPGWSEAGDQVRITTPRQAIENGSDYIVVGRPIVQAADRSDAAKRLLADIEDVR